METCINEQTQLLVPFWESLLDRSPEEMRTQMVMASHFAKINAVFMNKKPAEVSAIVVAVYPALTGSLDARIHTVPAKRC